MGSGHGAWGCGARWGGRDGGRGGGGGGAGGGGAVATATDFNKYKRFKYENMWSSRLDPLALYSLYTAGCT